MARLKGIDAVVGDRLRKLREANGMSREKLAERAGRSVSFLAKLELGSGRGRLETWQRLVQALGCTLADLFSESSSTSAREHSMPFGRGTARDQQLAVLLAHARGLSHETLAAIITLVRQLPPTK